MSDSTDFRPRGTGRTKKILLVGCLSLLILAILLVAVGAVVIRANWRDWTATGISSIMADGIRDTPLSNEDKAALIARVDLITEEFRNEALSLEDLERIGQAFVESPILPVAVVEGVQSAYIRPSALTDEEKASARRLNERLARGLFEKRITPEELEPVLRPLSPDDGPVVRVDESGGFSSGVRLRIKPPEQVTADELRAFMANAESLLTQKAIPDEPFEIDFVEEFDRAVEAAIGRRIAPEMDPMGDMRAMPGTPDMPDMPAMDDTPAMEEAPPASPDGG